MRGEKIVSLDAISGNYDSIKKAVGAAEVIGVIKADAYGHGGAEVAKRLGLKRYAVATVSEALEIREVMPSSEILVLGKTFYDEYEACVKKRISLTVDSESEVLKLCKTAKDMHVSAYVHLAINTGMNRIGAKYDKPLNKFVNAINESKNVVLSGAFTHFYRAEEDACLMQSNRFLSALTEAKITGVIKHAAATTAIKYESLHMDAVRPGVGLYGYGLNGLTPAMTVKGKVVAINRVAAGETVGYDGKFKAKRNEYVATLSLGYADGIKRRCGGVVLIGGKKRDMVGNVCMDTSFALADEKVKIGDEVVFIGRQKNAEITAEELAKRYGTIAYDVLTGFKRIKTVYL